MTAARKLEPAGTSSDTVEFDRMPPHDLSAEQSVLGAMLLSKDAIADVVEVLQEDDFYRGAHATIHGAILDLYGKGEPADPVTVAAELQRRGELVKLGGAPYLLTLISMVPTAANAAYYAEIVAEKSILRRLVEAGTRIVQLGYHGADGADVDGVVDRAQAAIYDVTERRTNEDYMLLDALLQPTMDELEAISSQGLAGMGVPTGLLDLDGAISGLHPGQMVIVAARPGLGKSTLGLDFARSCSIKHGMASAFFSLEMSRTEITMRLLSAEARVRLTDMRAGKMSGDDWERMARRMSQISEAPLFIDDSPNLTMMEIRAKARRLKQRHDLKLLVVDYLQLMTSGKRVESRQQEVSEFSRQIKLLAKELEIPVVAISQLNRGPEQRTDKRPMLSDLRESGCMTADTALMRADTGASITFGELMEGGHHDVLVWSLDAERKLVAAPVTGVFASGSKAVFRLRLRSGREVKASASHKFLTFNGWKSLEELDIKDRIAAPRRIPAPAASGLGWTEHRIGLLAHLIGDGCVLLKQPLHYTSEDEVNLDFVEQAATAEFGITPRRVQQGNWWHSYLPNPQRSARGRRNPLHVWFAEMGIEGLRSHEKRIPDALYGASNAEVAMFLRHLWATDGRVAEPSSMSSGIPALSYATTSRALADGVMTLLSRFGIATRILVIKEKLSARPGYRVTVQSGSDMRMFCQAIRVHGARGVRAERMLAELDGRAVNPNVDTLPREVWDLVKSERGRAGVTERAFQAAIDTHYCGSALYKSGISRDRLMRCADALDSDELRGHATSDVFWDEIVGIDSLGVLPVFDATVKGTHNFIANGVVAHNSLEQDADMVILLHRPDAFDHDDPRAGEADLILAKHRNGPTTTITVAHHLAYSCFRDLAKDFRR